MSLYWKHWKRRDPTKAVGGTSKMDATKVAKLRVDAEQGMNYTQLAAKYGISNVAARNIVRRLTWAQV